jgi:hypothetical protein
MGRMRTRSLCALALVALLALGFATSASARKPAAVRGTNTIVSSGAGQQSLDGGGLTYGTVAPGGIVRVVDLSPKHDGKFTVTSLAPATGGGSAQSVAVKPTKGAGGLLVFRLKVTRANLNRNLAFSVAGSRFRLVIDGQSVLNGAGVTGKVTLIGQGTISLNGQNPPLEWASSPRMTLPVKAPAPVKTTTTAPTKTTTTSTTTTSATAG